MRALFILRPKVVEAVRQHVVEPGRVETCFGHVQDLPHVLVQNTSICSCAPSRFDFLASEGSIAIILSRAASESNG